PFFLLYTPTTTQFYTLSLHDALPISILPGALRLASRLDRSALHAVRLPHGLGNRRPRGGGDRPHYQGHGKNNTTTQGGTTHGHRSEEHTSELQSRGHLVCCLLLEKKK